MTLCTKYKTYSTVLENTYVGFHTKAWFGWMCIFSGNGNKVYIHRINAVIRILSPMCVTVIQYCLGDSLLQEKCIVTVVWVVATHFA